MSTQRSRKVSLLLACNRVDTGSSCLLRLFRRRVGDDCAQVSDVMIEIAPSLHCMVMIFYLLGCEAVICDL